MYVMQSGISKQFKPRNYKLDINTHEDVTDIDRADPSGQYKKGPVLSRNHEKVLTPKFFCFGHLH